jgi:hypothetical protein
LGLALSFGLYGIAGMSLSLMKEKMLFVGYLYGCTLDPRMVIPSIEGATSASGF